MEKVVYPWYEEFSYRGLKINGKWQATLTYEHNEDKTKFHEDFEITQYELG